MGNKAPVNSRFRGRLPGRSEGPLSGGCRRGPAKRSFATGGIPGLVFFCLLLLCSCGWEFDSKESPPPAPPPAPTEVTATSGDGVAVVRWKSVEGALSYNLYWSEEPAVTRSTGRKIPGAASPFVHEGLVLGKTYYYAVTAVHARGESRESAVVSVSISGATAAPTGVTATGGDGSVTLRWDPVHPEATYCIYWSQQPGVTRDTGTKLTTTAPPFVHAPLANGPSYYYVVTAVHQGRESGESAEVAATPLKDPAGARMRVVWVQDGGDGSDPFAKGARLRLMGYDSGDGAGERVILGALRNYAKPLITPGGDRVVFSDRAGGRVYVAHWSGEGLRELAAGLALAVWRDPSSGTEWVYLGQEDQDERIPAVDRLRLDDPSVRERVWDRTMVTTDSFQLTRNGRLAGANVPWPDAGVFDVTDGRLWHLGKGCWTSLVSEGDRALFWVFDDAHRNVRIFDLTLGGNWQVNINGAPGIGGYEIYHPRWSNHPRVMAMTGPYTEGTGANRIAGGGKGVEVYVGRFHRDYTAIEDWTRITRNDRGDFFPDVWVAMD